MDTSGKCVCMFVLMSTIPLNSCRLVIEELRQKEIEQIDAGISRDISVKEGDIFSKKRWDHIQINLVNLKLGMDKSEVIQLIGYPDGIKYTPANIMQYSVAYGGVGHKQASQSLHILLNDCKRIVKIKKNAFIYGPPPEQ